MMIFKRPTAILAVLMLLAVTPAMSAIFRVQLKNGNIFQTRYQPKVAEWDENKVVFLTDVGNRITLNKDDIVAIDTDTQAKGFGTVLDTTTIVLGWAPNDAPTESDPSSEDQFAAYLDSLRRDRPVNTVKQFVNTEDAGQGGGLSTWEFGASNFTGGPAGQQSPPVFVPPPPTARPLPSGGGEGGPGPGGGGEN
jgi:hypothetical protein